MGFLEKLWGFLEKLWGFLFSAIQEPLGAADFFNRKIWKQSWCAFTFAATNRNKTNKEDMIIVPVKEGEGIERALKKFKRKFDKTGVTKELRARQQFDKPSVKRRIAKEHAIYVQSLRRQEEA